MFLFWYTLFIIECSRLNASAYKNVKTHFIQIYVQHVRTLFELVCSTSLLKPLQINNILPQTEVLLLMLNGNSDGAVDKYFFPDCLDPFFPGYHLRYQMTFPAL